MVDAPKKIFRFFLYLYVVTVLWDRLSNTPIQEKTGSRMETRPKGPSVFASPGGK